jgi:hypothetical protein
VERIRRVIVAIVFAGVLAPGLLLAARPAANESVDPKGRPPTPKNRLGVYVWHNDSGWHVRAQGINNQAHRINGTVQVVGGKVNKLTGFGGMEAGKKHIEDLGYLSPTRDLITFTFRVHGAADEFGFDVDDQAAELVFALAIDGSSRPEMYAIGANALPPTTNPFRLAAHPGKAGVSEKKARVK